MAAALTNHLFERRGITNAAASSCGIFAMEGAKVSKNAAAVLNQWCGIDISEHEAKMASEAILEDAHIIIAMTMGHKNHLCALYPNYASRVYAISEICPAGCDIEDPFGGDITAYKNCAGHIKMCIMSMKWEEYL